MLLKMRLRVFLDTNVFIYAFEFPESNSSKIIDLILVTIKPLIHYEVRTAGNYFKEERRGAPEIWT
jgi:predicted nucleic acid-binding protein